MAAGLVLAAGLSAGAAWYYDSRVSRCMTSPEFAGLEAAIEAQKQLDAARQRAEADKSPAARPADACRG